MSCAGIEVYAGRIAVKTRLASTAVVRHIGAITGAGCRTVHACFASMPVARIGITRIVDTSVGLFGIQIRKERVDAKVGVGYETDGALVAAVFPVGITSRTFCAAFPIEMVVTQAEGFFFLAGSMLVACLREGDVIAEIAGAVVSASTPVITTFGVACRAEAFFRVDVPFRAIAGVGILIAFTKVTFRNFLSLAGIAFGAGLQTITPVAVFTVTITSALHASEGSDGVDAYWGGAVTAVAPGAFVDVFVAELTSITGSGAVTGVAFAGACVAAWCVVVANAGVVGAGISSIAPVQVVAVHAFKASDAFE